ncbi:MAG: type II secretion system GspH family protein [Coriobacteriales bacterium]|nr:type II secretion system GspH family protein [Coriobacteriales bacterium]
MQARGGITDIEVVVVLLILAALIAMLVPALSGYASGAKGRGYTVQARGYATAAWTVLADAEASGTGTQLLDQSTTLPGLGFSRYEISATHPLGQKMSELVGLPKPASATSPGYWQIYLIGPKGSPAIECDGFAYVLYPQGESMIIDGAVLPSDDFCVVTFKMAPYSAATDATDAAGAATATTPTEAAPLFGTSAQYDPSEPYRVYQSPRFSG